MFLFASAAPQFFPEVVAIIVAGAVMAYVGHRFRLVPIVGFLLAGVVIGPHGLGLVQDLELVSAAAEVGVILLLFSIGIEFSLEKLARLQKLIFGGGGLQVGLATAATWLLLAAFGVDWRAGVFTGFLVALSSTAIVLKLLGDRGETSTQPGQVSLGLLIFQDLAVVVMVLVVPMLTGRGGSGWALVWALTKALAIIVAVLVAARRLMPPLLESVARTCSPELFLLTLIAVCFGTAYLTSLAGVSLSLGAFLAGLVVSESRFSEHAFGEILPLQILFSATFFVSVGLLLDVHFLFTHLPVVGASIVAILVLKVLTTGASVLALGFRPPVAVASALALAQIGEFSFVLERSGRTQGLFFAGVPEGSQAFIAATVMLMVLTPLVSWLGGWLAGRMVVRHQEHAAEVAAHEEGALDEAASERFGALENHVIVAGYGDGARRLVRVLRGSGIPFVITTLSPSGAAEAEAEDMPVLRGDYARQRTLLLVGAQKAKVLVVADDEVSMARRAVAVARTVNPTMRVVLRARSVADVVPLTDAGADIVITEEMESVVSLLVAVLRDYRLPAEEIDAHEAAVRRAGYAALREPSGETRPVVVCSLGEDCLDSREVTVRAGAPVAGRTVAELELERTHALRVVEVRREGMRLRGAAEPLRLEVGDDVTLVGDAEAFARGASLFRAPISGDASFEPPAAEASRPPQVADWIDTEATLVFEPHPGAPPCSHLAQIHPVRPGTRGCEECLRLHDRWVHLRLCLTCGHVGCCDDSKNRHATKHHQDTLHPLIRSVEPGEDWGWCYVDKVTL
ncbi:cation:proton antiporter [Corallococcus sp. M34]|uniref:cation:proton antiporter domain-containing protein n=1 Tax=Citreicoccus inhibens TaxID=2849499 RepID=UPI001C216DE4|nr:cation:proton antiporter [Citreicoccus inhibens]